MPAPKLSQVLSGTCGISRDRGSVIASGLGLSVEETELFLSLIEAEHGRSPAKRKKAAETLERLQKGDGFGPLDLERFKIISDWYHAALLEVPKLKNFRANTKWLSKRFALDESKVRAAIERLLDFGLLKKEGPATLARTEVHLATSSGIPSREIREYHSQILAKADQALEDVAITERDFSAITMAIDSSKMEEARKELLKFRRNFCKNIQSGEEKDRIYCLAIQFFPLDKGENI